MTAKESDRRAAAATRAREYITDAITPDRIGSAAITVGILSLGLAAGANVLANHLIGADVCGPVAVVNGRIVGDGGPCMRAIIEAHDDIVQPAIVGALFGIAGGLALRVLGGLCDLEQRREDA